jgi:antirestriction protein
VYVASLADYNAGRLHGAWIDAAQDVEQLEQEVEAMLAASPTQAAEEWAIHDYEGFGPLVLSEYESLERVSGLAQRIAEHGPAFAHWTAVLGPDDADPGEHFDDVYLGHWRSPEEYAEHLIADLGYDDILERAIPDSLRPYVSFDTRAFARDLELNGQIITSADDSGVYVFGSQ